MTWALELDSVGAAYGPFRALFDIDLSLAPGRTLAILGANGSGKSTIARVVSGLVPASTGSVRIGGIDATGWSTVRIRRAGVLHVPEGRGIFASLSVEQNLTLSLATESRRRRRARVGEAFERFAILGERRGHRAGTLSGGQQRLLSLATALIDPPRLLVADEISLGLAPGVLDEVYVALGEMTAVGTALVLIEQQTDRAVGFADEAAVLVHGRIVFRGAPSEAAAVVTHGMSTEVGDPT